jgi:NAD(P)-dependent dehydrogenase (short-subunit alcohol dehydrogenase family)
VEIGSAGVKRARSTSIRPGSTSGDIVGSSLPVVARCAAISATSVEPPADRYISITTLPVLVYTGSGINRMPDPFTGPYAASKAAGDVLAEVMALETARYGIETVIVQPGAYTSGTDHFKHAVGPLDHEVARQYGKLEGLSAQLANRLDGANLPGRRTDFGEVAEAIRDIVARASGTRPKRIDIDPQGREVGKINDLTAQLQRDYFGRMRMADLLEPTVSG